MNSSDPADKRCVLYVEDDRINVILVEEALRRRQPGWTLEVAESGAQALALLATLAVLPALVLIDVHLPDMSGIELIGRMRRDARWRGLRCVAVSADDPCDVVAAARQAGFEDFWLKPIDVSRLDA